MCLARFLNCFVGGGAIAGGTRTICVMRQESLLALTDFYHALGNLGLFLNYGFSISRKTLRGNFIEAGEGKVFASLETANARSVIECFRRHVSSESRSEHILNIFIQQWNSIRYLQSINQFDIVPDGFVCSGFGGWGPTMTVKQ